MKIDVSDIYNKVKAVNKRTGETKRVNLICLQEKKFNSPDDKWGIWYNFSKRGEWELTLYI